MQRILELDVIRASIVLLAYLLVGSIIALLLVWLTPPRVAVPLIIVTCAAGAMSWAFTRTPNRIAWPITKKEQVMLALNNMPTNVRFEYNEQRARYRMLRPHFGIFWYTFRYSTDLHSIKDGKNVLAEEEERKQHRKRANAWTLVQADKDDNV